MPPMFCSAAPNCRTYSSPAMPSDVGIEARVTSRRDADAAGIVIAAPPVGRYTPQPDVIADDALMFCGVIDTEPADGMQLAVTSTKPAKCAMVVPVGAVPVRIFLT